jgi:hypothetical protein
MYVIGGFWLIYLPKIEHLYLHANTLYANMMYDHGIPDMKITRTVLLEKIQQSIANYTITAAKGRKPSVIHSKEAGRSAIDQVLEDGDLKGKITTLYQCSKLIKQAILQTKKECPWSFEGSLVGSSETGVPTKLLTFMRWVLQGAKAATTEQRNEKLHKSCHNPSFKPERQRGKWHSPQL